MKKMRRLIPAIAMLLVSAVMLSTASFAWFTMNEAVTVEGVQIQAKADGSLLISDAPFSQNNLGAGDVQLTASVKNLKPMTYGTTAAAADAIQGAQLVGQTAAGWYKPTDNKKNDIVTGMANAALGLVVDDANASIADYNYKEEFYIATAGDAMKNANLTITLNAPVAPATGKTYKAYAAAVYVVAKTDDTATKAWADDADVVFVPDATNTTAATPDAIIFVDEYKENGQARNTVTLPGVTVPSIAGAVGETKVGLKVIVHFYVDGALEALKADDTNDTQKVNSGFTYTQYVGDWDDETPYYTVSAAAVTVNEGESLDGKYVRTGDAGAYVYTPVSGTAQAQGNYYTLTPVIANADDDNKAGITANDEWFTAEAKMVDAKYTYVRSADIPSAGTALKLTFTAVVPNP